MSKKSIKNNVEQVKKDNTIGAQRDLLEQLYDDHYANRWRIYKINFVRGIFFGFGSVLGATIVVSLLIWVLSLLNVPDNLLRSIETRQTQNIEQQ